MTNLERIEEIEYEIEDLEQELELCQDEDYYEDGYRDSLNELYTCELFGDVADALLQVDPTAYYCGLSDYADPIINEEVERIKNEISELKNELAELTELEV